jgi:hypothetical protein
MWKVTSIFTSPFGRGGSREDEGAEQLVLRDDTALALVDAEHDAALIVLAGRQRAGLVVGQRLVLLEQHVHRAVALLMPIAIGSTSSRVMSCVAGASTTGCAP